MNSFNFSIFQVKNIEHPKVKDLLNALHIQKFKIELIIKAIKSFKSRNLELFDSITGDCKCQTRTAIVIDLLNHKSCKDFFVEEEVGLEQVLYTINQFIQKINFDDYLQIKNLITDLKNINLYTYFNKNNLNFDMSYELLFITCTYFTSLQKKQLQLLTNNHISLNKINKFLLSSKEVLCDFVVNYENELACKYDLFEVKDSLQQIERKRCYKMTPFYPSFKPVLQKMKHKKEAFLYKVTKFCRCSGVREVNYKLFRPCDNSFIEDTSFCTLSDEVTMVIEGYQYNGSLEQLKNNLQVPAEHTFVSEKYRKQCKCLHVDSHKQIKDIEEAVLANFAQHRQFTNDAEIDFKGLGLEDSELKREYEYLKTLDGFGIHDMSKFCIKHIYPNTIAEEIKSAQQWHTKIKQPVKKPSRAEQGVQVV